MAITYVGQGAHGRSTGTLLTLDLNTGAAVGDLLVALMESSEDTPVTVAPGSAVWTAAPNTPVNHTANEGTGLAVFWRRATGSDFLQTRKSGGNHMAGRVIALRGVKKTGDPWEASGWIVGNEVTTVTAPSILTFTANTMVLTFATGASPDNSMGGWSNPGLVGLVTRDHDEHGAGNGGNQVYATGYKVEAGPTGVTTTSVDREEEWIAWVGILTADPDEDLPPDPGPGNQERFVYPVGIVSPIGNLIVELIRIDRELPYGTIAFDTWQWDTPEPLLEDRDRIDYYLAWQMMDNTMESQPKKIDAIRLTAKGNNPTVQIFAASPGDEISKEDLESGSNARASVRFEDSEEITRYERKKVKIKNLSIWTARYSGSWDGENEKDRLDELVIEGDIHGTTK